jgi:hypothetical protein
MAWSSKSERFQPPKLWKGMGTGKGGRYADHSCRNAAGNVAGGIAIEGEEGGAVAELVVVDELEGGLEVVDADDVEDGAQNFFGVDAHGGLDMVEKAGPEIEAVSLRDGGVAAVDDLLGAFGDERAEVASGVVPWRTLKTPSGRQASLSISTRRLEHLGSRSDGLRTKVFPQARAMGSIRMGTMAGKLKGGDCGDDAEELAHGIAVNAGADLLGEIALEKLGNSGGKFDDLEAAGGFAASVGEDFTMLTP